MRPPFQGWDPSSTPDHHPPKDWGDGLFNLYSAGPCPVLTMIPVARCADLRRLRPELVARADVAVKVEAQRMGVWLGLKFLCGDLA